MNDTIVNNIVVLLEQHIEPYHIFSPRELIYKYNQMFSTDYIPTIQDIIQVSSMTEVSSILSIMPEIIPQYEFFTHDFLNVCIESDPDGFMPLSSLVAQHADYLWNHVITTYKIFNTKQWRTKTYDERLRYLLDILQTKGIANPSFSTEMINYGFHGFSLYHANDNKRHLKIANKKNWGLWLQHIVDKYNLSGQHISDVHTKFNEKYGLHNKNKMSANKFKTLVKQFLTLKNERVYE